jgi:hypothetical protein
VVALTWVRARSSSVHPSRVCPCPFEGLITGEGQELAAQVLEWCCPIRTLRRRLAQCWRWPHNAEVGGQYPTRVIRGAASTGVRTWSSSVHHSRVLPYPFEGLVMGGGQELVAQCRGVTLVCSHMAPQYLHNDRGQPHNDGFDRTVPGGSDVQIPRPCQPRGIGGDLTLTLHW